VIAEVRAALADHRRMIVLLADETAVDERVTLVGKILHEQTREHLVAVADRLAATPADAGRFLDWLERDPELRDADKLAFRDLLTSLPSSSRVTEDVVALDRIEARYEQEVRRIFERLGTRAMVERRESWEAYLAYLAKLYDRAAVLAEHESEWRALSEGTRGGMPVWRDSDDEIVGRRLPDKAVVLTFDDGPAAKTTPQVLEILAKQVVPGVFFQVGNNVAHGKAESRRVLDAGHVLGNHSYTHAFLPKLTADALAKQIGDTNAVITGLPASGPMLFRPPYGARDEKVREAAKQAKMKIVLWNIDSVDWGDPVPLSIVSRVVAQVEKQGKGIVLFHDIHQRTVEALPTVIEELRKRGYSFLGWDGAGFSAPRGAGAGTGAVAAAPAQAAAPSLYRESWALVVGIDAYQKWPRLGHAVADARSVRDALVGLGWKQENIVTLLDGEATRARMLAALGDDLADGRRVAHEDRVVVFFAGHGMTRKLPNGKNLGYIVPVDADTKNPQAEAISMTNFQDASEAIPAKHVFFVMDACYGGLALTRGGGAAAQGDRRKYFLEVTRRGAREVLTAGGADEPVADNGPGGHSIFTWTLLQGLQGKADLDNDGVVTATELGAYVGPAVSTLSRQTPAFGHLVGSEGGEFVFTLQEHDEFLNADADSLEAEATRLNSELDRVQKAIAAKRPRPPGKAVAADAGAPVPVPAIALRGAGAADAGGGGSDADSPADQLRRKLDEGLALHKDKRFAEAAAAFEAATRLAPTNVLAANNLGFAYFKLERFGDAVTWYERSIGLDPRRAITYANLGDAYVKLQRLPEARRAYERYLELAPRSKLATGIKARLAATAPGTGDGGR
jgi:peptidoglycan/xylan/chitin deacetylase (PgdA/CDA1 family)/uncharacterized caspase-like protein